MSLETFRYDTAEHLKTDEDVALFLEAVMEEGDPTLIQRAIAIVARARGMTQIARDSGLSRESLYKALSQDGNPEFATILKVLKSLGLRLSVQQTEVPLTPDARPSVA